MDTTSTSLPSPTGLGGFARHSALRHAPPSPGQQDRYRLHPHQPPGYTPAEWRIPTQRSVSAGGAQVGCHRPVLHGGGGVQHFVHALPPPARAHAPSRPPPPGLPAARDVRAGPRPAAAMIHWLTAHPRDPTRSHRAARCGSATKWCSCQATRPRRPRATRRPTPRPTRTRQPPGS